MTVCHRDGVWEGDELNLYYPIFMTAKFLFIFGWLRVAETLYNPLGEDDEDFELNELIVRHIKVAMTIVDDGDEPPPLERDVFWNEKEPELCASPSHVNTMAGLQDEVTASQVVMDISNTRQETIHGDGRKV